MENEIKDSSDLSRSEQILNVSDFEELNLPEVLSPYQGEGKTSFKAEDKGVDYDSQKKAYLESLGFEIPSSWIGEDGKIAKDCRALFVSTFVITGHVLVCEEIRRTLAKDSNFNQEVFEEVLKGRDSQIREHRLDVAGMRKVLPDGSMVESYYEKMGLSANPEKRVSKEELVEVVDYIFSQLKKGI
jgi:hypothetical protein